LFGVILSVDEVEKEIFKEKIQMYVKTEAAIKTAMKSLYDLIWGQCSKSLPSRLRSDDNFATYLTTTDSLAQLKAIRSEMTGFRNKQYLTHALCQVMKDFYSISQGKHPSNQEYYDEFNSLVLTGEECGATIGAHPGAINNILVDTAVNARSPTTNKHKKATKTATDRYLAVAFLLSSDRICYKMIINEIKNKYLRNWNDSSKVGTYPTTVAKAYDYLCNYKKDLENLARLLQQQLGGENLSLGVSFAQPGKPGPGKPKDNTETQETAFATNSALNQARKKVCERCGVNNHTSVECDTSQDKVAIFCQSQQANQGVSQLIHLVTWDDINAPDEATNFAFLGKASFTADGPTQCTEFCKDGTNEQVHKTTIAWLLESCLVLSCFVGNPPVLFQSSKKDPNPLVKIACFVLLYRKNLNK
jgi:hypothetical protein